MIDTWHLIVYLAWHILYGVISTLLYIYFMHVISYSVYFYASIIVICTHCFFTCTFPFYFIHSLGRFLTSLDLHVQILNVLFYCSSVRWNRTCCEESEFSYLVVPSRYIVTLFYSCCSFWFHILDFCSILSFICYIVLDSIMSYCSDFDLS